MEKGASQDKQRMHPHISHCDGKQVQRMRVTLRIRYRLLMLVDEHSQQIGQTVLLDFCGCI